MAPHVSAFQDTTRPTGLSERRPSLSPAPRRTPRLRPRAPYHGGRKGKLAVPERPWLIEERATSYLHLRPRSERAVPARSHRISAATRCCTPLAC
ncbi:hypothetical protein ZWY2020_016391 [Hordeum vulgare]|nr:hypothetical protein ZWY2020_031019 [Hordeum vulgare]KAI4979638.1 hypothetical protein ZWY2020_016391 [Hordeum vulgare]